MAPLKISIPTTHTDTPEHGKPFTEYEIRISHPFSRTATLRKRYSDFATLDSSLRSQVGAAPPAPLPPKSWLGGALGSLGIGSTLGSPEQIERRREGLEAYLQSIETSEDGRWRVSKVYKDFLQLSDTSSTKTASYPGSQFGKDRVRDSSDWLEKHGDVKRQLQDARLWLTKREQANAATAQHEAGSKAKSSLVRAGTLLSALEEGLNRLSGKGDWNASNEGDWGGEKLGEGEVRRRRDMIGTLKKEKDSLESVLNAISLKSANAGSGIATQSAAVTSQQKEGLFSTSNSKPSASSGSGRGGRVLGAAKETERTRELDNEGVLQLQKQIISEQDEDLVDLTQVVRRMKEMGVQINEEIVEQNAMLGLLDEDVERVDGKIKIAKQRIGKIR